MKVTIFFLFLQASSLAVGILQEKLSKTFTKCLRLQIITQVCHLALNSSRIYLPPKLLQQMTSLQALKGEGIQT